MSWLVDNLRRQDTVDVAGPVGQALRQLQEMACSPLDRLKTIRVCAKTFEKVRQDLRVTRASSSSALSVDVDVNPFVPEGYILGFSRQGEMLFIIKGV